MQKTHEKQENEKRESIPRVYQSATLNRRGFSVGGKRRQEETRPRSRNAKSRAFVSPSLPPFLLFGIINSASAIGPWHTGCDREFQANRNAHFSRLQTRARARLFCPVFPRRESGYKRHTRLSAPCSLELAALNKGEPGETSPGGREGMREPPLRGRR